MDNSPFSLLKPPTQCKICQGSVVEVGAVDKNQTQLQPEPFPASQEMVSYYQCQECGFAWAPVFDEWSKSQFSQYIYNQDIGKVETAENAHQRADNVLEMFQQWFKKSQRLRMLDYGCGPGIFVDRLKQAGFDAEGYDPYYPGADQRPSKLYDVIACFEVLEHANHPHQLLKDIASFLRPGGVIIMGTFFTQQPLDLNWWYVSPRGGHISFYTYHSLNTLLAERGFQLRSDRKVLHIAYKDPKSKLLKRITIGR